MMGGRNVLALNVHVKQEWNIDEFHDFVNFVYWRIQASLNYDPVLDKIVGGDLNKKGMKELEPRLFRFGLRLVFC
jgi:hypothetical protein